VTDQQRKTRQTLVARFRGVARERLQRLNTAFVELEQNPDDGDSWSMVLREIHTLKGEAKLMGFADVNLVAHKLEDLLLHARDRKLKVQPRFADFVLEGFDVVTLLLDKQAGGEVSGVDLNTFVGSADRLLSGAPAAAPRPAAPTQQLPAGGGLELATPGEPRKRTTLRVDVHKLDTLAELSGDLLRQRAGSENALHRIGQISECLRDELRALKLVISGPQPAGQAGGQGLQELWADLNEAQARLEDLQGQLASTLYLTRDEIFEGRNRLDELEDAVRDLRLLPLSSLLGRYPRAIRDMAKEQGKQVSVSATGGEIEIDKQVLDQLGEPLLHLIRNAVDHGLEPPQERVRAGKGESGSVSLEARQSGSMIEIEVRDDGRGVQQEDIRQAVVAAGVMSMTAAGKLRSGELLQMLFRPGLSTRARATDLSGRGIGLDVVKERIESLGGSVQLHSLEGQGTRVGLTVPVSMALMRVLVMELGDGYYAVPLHAVSAVTEVAPEQQFPAGNGLAFSFEDALIPLHPLERLLEIPSRDGQPTERPRVVVVHARGRQVGLEVRGVMGERELVQRPLDPFLEAVPLVIGMAVLEHSQPTLILNVSELVSLALRSTLRPVQEPDSEQPARQRSVLLVEDSELTRDMLDGVLSAMGHQVLDAANGRDALEKLQQSRPDLVITDLEMPVMDGFDLIAAIRGSETLRELPIIVLTSRGSEEDKRRAAELGADAYLVKSKFREEILEQTVDRFLDPGGR
jgi:chemotaxis protein histidine kinase CheA/CheY-like chemotaxis protein